MQPLNMVHWSTLEGYLLYPLSGSQKTRVPLRRAFYTNAKIIFLDAILSAFGYADMQVDFG